ncbi:hypothetical protein [Tenacibaculum sp. SG-28]|uniref:hypothetical protein n=1 Tax=Tenacibaculum sp. SG-28 TaxID=754426 RepID=UPI000CF4FFAF|nr:hypothetical protein [Tenacibaculum sp. SG-28]PQJ18717.1 hypothetical protein BSU00_12645 [Tenacibaculum sp. SG-28]
MKIGILSPIPFGISWILSIIILGVTIGKLELLDILNKNYRYLTVLLIVLIISKTLHYFYSGKIKITSISDENFEIKIKKLPLFSKLKNQTIKLTDIEYFRVSKGRACDRIIIELKNKENVRICTDNLKNFLSLRDEKKDLINLFTEKNIEIKKASWYDSL